MNVVMIAEKPSVGRTYADALDLENPQKKEGFISGRSRWDGNFYWITWSVGHLVTLSYPEKYNPKYKNWNFDDLPFLPDKYKYEVIKESSKQFKIVKELYNKPEVNQIVYAGDSGREGILIQTYIKMLAGNNGHVTEKVLWIDSQTKEEIRNGLLRMKPFSAYSKLIDAGFMRAIEDYAFGLNYSRMLSCKFGKSFNDKIRSQKWKPITVGRVMTCVLGMVVSREREIRNFKPTNFSKIFANCSNGKYEFSADWIIDKESKYYNSPVLYDNKGFLNESDANAFLDELSIDPKLVVISIEDKIEKKSAPLLFNLAELQNSCTKKFKITPNQTLDIAQSLYEKQLTTYPRTDARYLSTAICKEIDKNLNGLKSMGYNQKFIEQILTFGMYSGIESTKYCNDSKITDHYAIIPTGQGDVSGLSELELAVYQMIVDRFICIFLPQAEFNTSTAILKAHNNERFKIAEKTMTKVGFLEVLKGKTEDSEDCDGVKLSQFLMKGDEYDAEFFTEDGTTSPPKRYTSGSMILAMENAGNLIEDEELRAQIKGSGIGTSATRAGILEKLIKIGYLCVNKKTQVITPHTDGEAVYDIVNATIPSFLSPKMTASWEKGLSEIEDNTVTKAQYEKVLNDEIRKTYEKLKAIPSEEHAPRPKFASEETELTCPICGKPVITTRYGYKCQDNQKGSGCSFFVSEIGGVKITPDMIQLLATEGRTGTYTFTKKSGKGSYKAALAVDKNEKKIILDFENKYSKIS